MISDPEYLTLYLYPNTQPFFEQSSPTLPLEKTTPTTISLLKNRQHLPSSSSFPQPSLISTLSKRLSQPQLSLILPLYAYIIKPSELNGDLNVINANPANQKQYNNYLAMNPSSQLNIFFEERQETSTIQIEEKDLQGPASIPYLKKGDSNIYLEQFLAKEDPQEPSPSVRSKEESKHDENYSGSRDEDFQIQEPGKFNPSAFHNFQKHLTVCLKHSIDLVNEDKLSKDYQIAASKLWKTFKNSSISTKKVLHYLLGEKNEHKITEQGIKEYGLQKIYEAYGEKLVQEAKKYLAAETLRQIREGKLESYINAKKLKDKEKFRKYVNIFVEELESGYLRKRLPKEKVNYLLRA